MAYPKGIDISIVQQNVDFNWVANKGYSFAIIRNYVGNDGQDSNYLTNLTKAKAAGLNVAVYNFIYPLPTNAASSTRDPVKQAELHFSHTNGELTAVDIEWPEYPDWSKWGCSSSQINDWCLKYLERYTQLDGRKPLVYTYPSFAQCVNFSSDITQYPLWIASYTQTPTIPHPWTDWYMWQDAGGSALVLPNGIKCDTDEVKDLSWWGINNLQSTTSVEAVSPVQNAPQSTYTVQTAPTPPPPVQTAITQPKQSIFTSIFDVLKTINFSSLISTLTPIVKALFHIN